MNKTEKMLQTLQKACQTNSLNSHPIIIAVCIAMEHCEDTAHIEQYGTIALEIIRQWRDEWKK